MNGVKHYVLSIENIFFSTASIIVGIFLISVLLAEAHLFHLQNILLWYSIFGIACIVSVILYFQEKFTVSFSRDKHDVIAVILVISICAFNVFYFHESFAGGRDDGVYANTALYLVRHNSLYITQRIVATYPGFMETSHGVISQFYVGYPIWIAT